MLQNGSSASACQRFRSALRREVLTFPARGPQPSEIVAFPPSAAAAERMRELLRRKSESIRPRRTSQAVTGAAGTVRDQPGVRETIEFARFASRFFSAVGRATGALLRFNSRDRLEFRERLIAEVGIPAGALVQIAVMTGQSQIFRSILTPVLACHDMLNVETQRLLLLNQRTIFTAIIGAASDELTQARANHTAPASANNRRALAWRIPTRVLA